MMNYCLTVLFLFHDITLLQDEDEDLARALQLSVGADSAHAPSAFADPSFASSLLSSADPNDPQVQAALAALGAQPPAPGDNSKDADNTDATGKKRDRDSK